MYSVSSEDPGIYVRTLEIQWHYAAPQNREEAERRGVHGQIEGIISIDFHPTMDRICTTGGDGCIMIWQLHTPQLSDWLRNATQDVTKCVGWVATLDAGEMPRTARWSPGGKMIASAHSDSRIRLWWQTASSTADATTAAADCAPLETWKDYKQLTGHAHEVMDVMFSPDSRFVASICMQGNVIIHDLDTCSIVVTTHPHPKFGFSVLWDPWCHFVTSFGCTPSVVTHTVVPPTEHRRLSLTRPQQVHQHASFVGESCSSSLRRLSWSPDGALLAIPCGKAKASNHQGSDMQPHDAQQLGTVDVSFRNCVYLFQRGQVERPALSLGIRGALEIRGTLWAQCFFEPYPQDVDDLSDAKGAWGPGEYRMALAVWTEDTVIVYTTDQSVRHSDFTDLHMHSITDVAWSNDARFLLTCSLDGYITVVHYGKELGAMHELPLFTQAKVPLAIAKLKQTLSTASEQFEMTRTDTAKTQTATVQQAHVARKKRKVDPAAVAAPVQDVVGVEELASLLD